MKKTLGQIAYEVFRRGIDYDPLWEEEGGEVQGAWEAAAQAVLAAQQPSDDDRISRLEQRVAALERGPNQWAPLAPPQVQPDPANPVIVTY